MTRNGLKLAAAALTGTVVVRLLALTWRVRIVNPEVFADARGRGGPVIFVVWHGQLLPLLYAHRDRGIAVIISEHRDGELIARIAMRLGFATVRGSTSRGATRALIASCRAVESGADLAVTVDGPRGPAHSVAPGSLVVSQRTGAPLLPVAATANRVWHLKSWDRFMIPKPFARVQIAYGVPLTVTPGRARDAAADTDAVRARIEAAELVAQASLAG